MSEERLGALEQSRVSVTPYYNRRRRKMEPKNVYNVSAAPGSSYYELASAVTLISAETGTVSWTTLDLSANIPTGTIYVDLEVEYCINDTTGSDTDAYLRGRASSGSLERVLARGRSAGNADDVAGAVQVRLRASAARSIDYEIEGAFQGPAGNGPAGLTMRLVGYWV